MQTFVTEEEEEALPKKLLHTNMLRLVNDDIKNSP